MLPMPRPRKPYVQREVTRHGTTVWYFRKGAGPRVRLRGSYESQEWLEDYERALTGGKRQKPPAASSGTVAWLIGQYLDSGRFFRLAPETKAMRKRILAKVAETGGHLRYDAIRREDIMEAKTRREATPFAAVNHVKVLKQLFAFAVDSGYLSKNPAADVKTTAPKSDGHHTWTVQEVEVFRSRHHLGTMPRLALELMLFTGLRRGDANKLGRQHVRDGRVRIKTGKNKYDIDIPLLATFAAAIASMPGGELTFIRTAHGRPFKSAASFGMWFGKRCEEAGLSRCSAHGLRKAGATLAAENGANALDLSAMYGWHDPRQAEVYIRKANRKVMAERAANALSPHLETGAGETATNVNKINGR